MAISRPPFIATLVLTLSCPLLILAAPGFNATSPSAAETAKPSEFLLAHNIVRARAGLPPLMWDHNLAVYARRFASSRALDCKMLHSYGPYGENIFWGGAGGSGWSPADVVRSWVSEEKFYDREKNACAAGQMCGHYTQVVWRNSRRLGCAGVTCNDGGFYAICAYDPPGNFVDESPFGGRPTTLSTSSSSLSSSSLTSPMLNVNLQKAFSPSVSMERA